MAADRFTMTITERDGLTLVELAGELDLASSPELGSALEGLSGDDRRAWR